MQITDTWRRLAVAIGAVAVLAACGSQTIEEGGGGNGQAAGADCGDTVNIAVNPWVGYEANVAVIKTVLEQEFGCTVETKDLKEEIAWQGFQTGEVDAIVENWGHPDLKKKYIDQLGVAELAGKTGNIGNIGWWVPPWLAEAHPDVLQWQNLDKYSEEFQTSESGDKGAFLAGDPSFVTQDAAVIDNLNLDFEVIYTGSEAALIQAFRQGQEQKDWVLGYFYEPQWFLAEVPLKEVQLPPYGPKCATDPQKIACDYPIYKLDKVVSKEFAESGSPAYEVIKNFQWTNKDQNVVAGYIAQGGMSMDAAGRKWVKENPDIWKKWLPS